MKIEYDNEKIKVETGYNKNFISKAHKLAGKWENPFWVFPKEVEKQLDDALFNIYGEGLKPRKFVKIRVELPGTKLDDEEDLFIGGWRIAYRPGRDSQVRFSQDGSYVESGDFEDRGGSVAHPWVKWKEGTTVVTSIPEERLEKAKKEFGDKLTVLKAELSKKQLLERKAELEKELAEINKKLEEA